jgi:hypothetical protein
MYQLFYDGDVNPRLPQMPKRKSGNGVHWGERGKDARTLERFRQLLSRADEDDRQLLMHMAKKMAKANSPRSESKTSK